MKGERYFETHEALEAAVTEAERLWRTGQWRGALLRYIEIFAQRSEDLGRELTPADLTILERIADLAVPLGLLDHVDDILNAAGANYSRLGDRCWSDRMLVKRVHLLLNAQQMDSAFSLFARLLASDAFALDDVLRWQGAYPAGHDADRRELFAQTWLELGRLLHLRGQNSRALICFDHGRSVAVSPAVNLALSLAQVRCSIEFGRLTAAEEMLRGLVIEAIQFPAQATAHAELAAKLHLLRGDFGAARRELANVWHICELHGFAAPILRAALNHAQVAILVNETAEARGILQAVAAEARRIGDQALLVQAERLITIAAVRFRGVERVASVTEEQAAVECVERPDPTLSGSASMECYTLAHFEDRALAFQFHFRRRDWVAARRCLDRLAPFAHTDSEIVRVRLAAMTAALMCYAEDSQRGERLLEGVCAELLGMGLKPERWEMQVLRARLTPDPVEQARLRDENDRLLDEIGATLPLRPRVTFLLDKANQLDEALAVRVNRLQELRAQVGSGGPVQRLRGRLALWRESAALLEAAYWQREAHNAGLLDDRNPDAARKAPVPRWRRLFWRRPTEATICILVLPDSAVVICQRWMSIDVTVCAVDRPTLRGLVADWHGLVAASDPEEQAAVLRRLASALKLDKLEASLPRWVKRMRIVPDDALHGVPFAAIERSVHTGQQHYWCDRFTITIAFQPERRPRPHRPGPCTPVLVAVTEGGHGFPPLPETPGHVTELRNWFTRRGHRTQTLFDEEATVDTVSAALTHATVCHVTCHGTFEPDQPARTGLVLGGPAADPLLTVTRLASMDLSRLEHATLVACWAADNYILPGRWILSLPEALWRSGTGSVLASLWEVDEHLAARLVRLFHDRLATDAPDAALRYAQRRMRADAGAAREVVTWAAFQVFGDPRRPSL